MTEPLDPPLCADLKADQRRVLQTIYDTWTVDVSWPWAQWIDKVLDRDHGLDLEKLLPTIPDRYILFNTFSPINSELKLTVAGISCCDNGAADVQLFIRMLRWCVQHERDFQPSLPTKEEELRVTSKQLEKEWTESGEDVSNRILSKAFALVEVEQFHRGSHSATDPTQSYVLVNRDVRRYRPVHAFEDYLALKEEARRELRQQPPIVYTHPGITRRPFTSTSPSGAVTALMGEITS